MTTTAEENKRIARRIPEEILTEGNLELVEELFARDAVDQAPLGTDTGWDEIRAGMETIGSFVYPRFAERDSSVSTGSAASYPSISR